MKLKSVQKIKIIALCSKVSKYLELLNNFTLWLEEKDKLSKDDVSSACNDYLKVFGYIALAHSWLKVLKVSHEKIDKNKNFLKTKLIQRHTILIKYYQEFKRTTFPQ